MNYKFLILTLFTAVLLLYGYHQAMYVAPEERSMGEIQRIFYYHVPSAWTSFICFFANLIASVAYLAVRKANPSAGQAADAVAVASAEVGVVFCTIVLVTGPLWAKPVWGIWWTWDARLTTTLILWLIYVSYLFLRHYAAGGQAPTLAAVVAIIGFLDVPLVYMAIRWFRTQHPQPVMAGGEGSGLDPAMWVALRWNWAAFIAFGFLLIWTRYRLVRFQQQLDELHALAALKGGAR
jgi:heme exporter protein C